VRTRDEEKSLQSTSYEAAARHPGKTGWGGLKEEMKFVDGAHTQQNASTPLIGKDPFKPRPGNRVLVEG